MNETYECDKCGACCQGGLIVEADWLDLSREPRLLEADRHRAGWTLDEALTDLEEPGKAMIVAAGCHCPFLNGDNHCEIHPTRPTVCVGLQAGDEQWQAARKDAGLEPLLPLSEQGELCECEKPGHFHSGVPGILAHVENGKIAADAKVERCDLCARYPTDEAAREKLIELGKICEADPASEGETGDRGELVVWILTIHTESSPKLTVWKTYESTRLGLYDHVK
ncbi:Flagellin N-methylase [Symmachiella dynata]|uniref:Flagellin N-methylase n=1 Tax=Symmachiella dynata TaxID=2527995 RepID=A0A517ZKB1_9PLAN|nr:YkgJ family cysteine cluster protein [Symmachiella dynata]QDU42885.1 Flagellin N-methylase [Symmachiella dynata]